MILMVLPKRRALSESHAPKMLFALGKLNAPPAAVLLVLHALEGLSSATYRH
jgi:hypothetical protein